MNGVEVEVIQNNLHKRQKEEAGSMAPPAKNNARNCTSTPASVVVTAAMTGATSLECAALSEQQLLFSFDRGGGCYGGGRISVNDAANSIVLPVPMSTPVTRTATLLAKKTRMPASSSKHARASSSLLFCWRVFSCVIFTVMLGFVFGVMIGNEVRPPHDDRAFFSALLMQTCAVVSAGLHPQ